MMIVLLSVHIQSAVFWVGGMFFALNMLRPAAVFLAPEQRMPPWRGVFARFLPAVGIAIALLLACGFWMIFQLFAGFAAAPPYVNAMMGIGILMMLLYLHLVFAPWRRFRAAVDSGAFAEAAPNLANIRRTVFINTTLGVITIIIGATGRFW